MMKNPRLEIDLDKIYHNTRLIVDICRRYKIDVVGVTKSVCAIPELVNILLDAGIKKIGDSRLQNIIKLRDAGLQCEMQLIRIPMISEALEVVQYSDVSYQTELRVIEEFNRVAKRLRKKHEVMLMVEVGDLREGILPGELDDFVASVLKMENIKLKGLGMNVGCYGGVLPSFENTSLLVNLRNHLAQQFNIQLPIVSGGSSSTLKLLEREIIAPGINEIRVGEAIFLGTGASAGGTIPSAYIDAFKLIAELIEVREKPSVPKGVINKDAFGNTPKYIDRGIRKRALFAVGRQDVVPEALIPLVPGMEILGASSDHLIVDINDCKQDFQIGDEIVFIPDYGGLLRLMTSPYVRKVMRTSGLNKEQMLI